MEWLSDSPWLAWLGIALVLGAIEALTVDFVFLMLAGGALAGAAAAAVGGGLVAQVVVAVVASIALVGVVRPLLRRHFLDGEIDHGIGVSGLVGREARVLSTVTETEGQVKLAGETWSARTADGALPIPAGQEVVVLTLQGAIAVVAPAAPRRELPST